MTEITTHLFNPICIHHSNIPVKQSWLDFAAAVEYQRNSLNNNSFTESTVLDRLPDLKQSIISSFADWMYNYHHLSPSCTYHIDQAWINRHSTGDWAQVHNHPDFDYSGVYYLNVPPDSGGINFSVDPFHSNFYRGKTPFITTETLNNSLECSITPENGDLVIFPSFLSHSVEKNMTSSCRYSLAFDICIKQNAIRNYAAY